MFVFVVLAFVGLKAYQTAQTAPLTTVEEQNASLAASQASGVAPANGMPSSPSPQVPLGTTIAQNMNMGGDDDSDDGAMTATVMATSISEGPEPRVMSDQSLFDTNETQATSGQDNPHSMAFRVQGYPKNNKSSKMDEIWKDACDASYISSQPGIQNYFHAPGIQRQDWNPSLNDQPWARNTSFKSSNDPTSHFDTDEDGIPSVSNYDEEDA